MTTKQYTHHKKPGGQQTLPINKWVAVAGLGTFKTNGFGHIKSELYINVNFEDSDEKNADGSLKYPGGGVIEARMVRKAFGKLPVDVCGADNRALMRGIKHVGSRMKVNEPVRNGENGRTYYWQVRVRGVKSAVLTTRYDDFWRMV